MGSVDNMPANDVQVLCYVTARIGMQRSWYRKLAVRVSIAVAGLLISIAMLFTLELRRTQAQLGEVLSDLFSEGVLREPPDVGSGLQIVIQGKAETPGMAPGATMRPSPWLDEKLRFPQASPVSRISFLLANAFPTEIRANIRLPRGAEAFFLSSGEFNRMTPHGFQQRFPKPYGQGYFAVSQAGFNFSKTEAILYANHFCAGLCGGGGYILARKVNGVWRVVDQHESWVS
ncbi:MAG: hypothetical protein JWO20_3009 [Candidatus Angelobacter sp.]|jgi:hypothetical protein|nr:hypothetical protein [Candidatus Angelobacter sp.]